MRFVANSISLSITFAQSPDLSTDTTQSIIDGLADLTGGTSQEVDFHANVILKITDEQWEQIINKNWSAS